MQLNEEKLESAQVVERRRVPEILAPAGGREQFFAALNAGADAVFLGLKQFNARSRAANFTPDELRVLVPLAHRYGMQVLVTVNVLIKDAELPELIHTLATLEAIGVDAIIVQDLGVARLVRAHFPTLRLHASTQMAVHNQAGVEEAAAAGFKRVVLARELTALEVRKIRSGTPRDVAELEVFCHGSLCYSYSGLCFFSGAEDARSGNRGECAYTCRQPYKIVSEPGHGFLFSMRDLDTSAHLDLLIDAGVDTLKIEGRKKDAQYVATTVKLYRDRLNQLFGRDTLRANAPSRLGFVTDDIHNDLALAFQRRPTTFFVEGRYHENVIDLASPTHQGLQVGKIEALFGTVAKVRTAVPLERFDGLRIVPAAQIFHALPQNGAKVVSDTKHMANSYENKHLEFSLRDFNVQMKRAFTAKVGDLVEIHLPEETRDVKVGDLIFKTRSADLKRRVTELTQPPKDAKLKAWHEVDVTVAIAPAGDMLRLSANVEKFGVALTTAEISLAMEKPRQKTTLAADVEDLLTTFGDQGFVAKSVRLSGDFDWFAPRSKLKELKLALAATLPEAYATFLREREDRALRAVLGTSPTKTTATLNDRTFALKTDRLETLRYFAELCHTKPEWKIREIVFEPKRAFLNELNPLELADSLASIKAASGVKLRIALPTVIRGWDEPLLKRWLQAARDKGLTAYEVGNIGAFGLLRKWELPDTDLASDFTLYALNSGTTRFWRERGVSHVCLSIEDDAKNLATQCERLRPDELATMQVILYKDTPLFIAEACSLTALHNGCPTSKVCGYRSLTVENPKGEKFHVAHETCKSIVYGDDAYSITQHQDKLVNLGLTNFRLDFLTRAYSPERIEEIIAAAQVGKTVTGTHSANFTRELL